MKIIMILTSIEMVLLGFDSPTRLVNTNAERVKDWLESDITADYKKINQTDLLVTSFSWYRTPELQTSSSPPSRESEQF